MLTVGDSIRRLSERGPLYDPRSPNPGDRHISRRSDRALSRSPAHRGCSDEERYAAGSRVLGSAANCHEPRDCQVSARPFSLRLTFAFIDPSSTLPF